MARVIHTKVTVKRGASNAELMGAITDGLMDAANLTLDRARVNIDQNGTSNTGELLSSGDITERRDADAYVRFGFTAPHAIYIEEGTGPRDKLPPRDAIRRWVQLKLRLEGDELERATTAIVWHIKARGTPAQPFFGPALEQTAPEVARYIRARTAATLQQHRPSG